MPILVAFDERSVSKVPTLVAFDERSVSRVLTREAFDERFVSKVPTLAAFDERFVSKVLTRAAFESISSSKELMSLAFVSKVLMWRSSLQTGKIIFAPRKPGAASGVTGGGGEQLVRACYTCIHPRKPKNV